MKIIYVGKFKHSYATENYVLWALKKLGHEVHKIPSSYLMKNKLVENKIRSVKPDFVLFSKGAESFRIPFLLSSLKQQNILSVCWLWDLYLIPERPVFPELLKCNMVFSTDGNLKKFSSVNSYHVLRQGIHTPESYWLNPNYQYDIGFVGHSGERFQSQRIQLIKFLRSTHGNKFIHHTTTRGNNLNRALSETKIIIGDSYPAPDYWSNRVYEITGRGGFILMPTIEGTDFKKEYQLGKHYDEYTRGDFVTLKTKIDYYLKHESYRESIRLKGFAHTHTNYTYTHRVEELISKVKSEI